MQRSSTRGGDTGITRSGRRIRPHEHGETRSGQVYKQRRRRRQAMQTTTTTTMPPPTAAEPAAGQAEAPPQHRVVLTDLPVMSGVSTSYYETVGQRWRAYWAAKLAAAANEPSPPSSPATPRSTASTELVDATTTDGMTGARQQDSPAPDSPTLYCECPYTDDDEDDYDGPAVAWPRMEPLGLR